MPLRVAYVVHTFDMGGLERCVARLVNRLDPTRFEPIIVCMDRNGDAAQWLQNQDVPIVELHTRAGNDPLVIRRLANTLRENQIDIVHSHNWGTLLETVLARRWAAVPCHIHAERGMSSVLTHGLRARLRARAIRWALNRADAVVAVSGSVRQSLLDRCGRLMREVQVIPNGVDVPAEPAAGRSRDELRASLNVSPSAFVVGSVGRLVPIKEFGTAIDAVGQLVSRGSDVYLLLVGDGPEMDRLARHAKEAGLDDRVHLVGQQSDVGAWLAAMDLYVNVSRNEGMSQSILEAMAIGLPMVVTDVGQNATLAGGENPCGRVVVSGDCHAVARAIAELHADRELRRGFSHNALARHGEHYGIEKMICTYEELYTRLLGVHGTPEASEAETQALIAG